MLEWLGDNQWAGWLALALVLGTVEIMTLDLVFLMLAGGAVAATVAALLGAPFLVAAIVAVVGAAALLGVVRPVALRHLELPKGDQRMGVAALVGKQAVVLERIDESHGLVKLAGETWTARPYVHDVVIEAGRTVDVVEIQGATALVYPADNDADITVED